MNKKNEQKISASLSTSVRRDSTNNLNTSTTTSTTTAPRKDSSGASNPV